MWDKIFALRNFLSLQSLEGYASTGILYNTLGAINFHFSTQYLQTVFQANIIVNNLGTFASVCLPGPSKHFLSLQCKIRHYCSCRKKTFASKFILKNKKISGPIFN
jgi:hypothetical protein